VRSPGQPSFAIRPVLILLVMAAGIAALVVFGRGTPAAPPPLPAQPSTSSSPSTARIVSLSPAIAVILRDLGCQSLIVGRDGYDMVLPRSVPVCGDLAGIDYERLLQVHPTHILMQLGNKPVPDRLKSMAAEHSWTVTDFPLLTLDDIREATLTLEHDFVVGEEPPAILDAMDQAWVKRGDGFAAAGRVLLLAATDPPSVLGPGSFHHQILEKIGGVPAITDGSPYITLDSEDVLKLKPDAIILILPRSPDVPASEVVATPEQILVRMGRLGKLDIPAIRNRRLAMIDNPLAHTPSTAMVGLADEMAKILAGWNRAR
jgi:ABC-type Fe3+-hydroxamate transport system substrate-binding protein